MSAENNTNGAGEQPDLELSRQIAMSDEVPSNSANRDEDHSNLELMRIYREEEASYFELMRQVAISAEESLNNHAGEQRILELSIQFRMSLDESTNNLELSGQVAVSDVESTNNTNSVVMSDEETPNNTAVEPYLELSRQLEQRQRDLEHQLAERDALLTELQKHLDTYEAELNELIVDKEQIIENYESKLAEMKQEEIQQKKLLDNLEMTYSEVQLRYENGKNAVEELKKREDTLKNEQLAIVDEINLLITCAHDSLDYICKRQAKTLKKMEEGNNSSITDLDLELTNQIEFLEKITYLISICNQILDMIQ